jgi:hypothetical protein
MNRKFEKMKKKIFGDMEISKDEILKRLNEIY